MLWAERYARLKGRWMNVWVTINFPADTPDQKKRKGKWKDAYGNKRTYPYVYRNSKRAYDIFREIWDATRRRWNREFGKGGQNPFDAIAVFERKVIKSRIGNTRHSGPEHVHWLLRWPKSDWKRLAYFIRRKMVAEVSGMIEKDVYLRRVDYQVGVAKYMAKGIDPPFARTFYLRYRAQGRIDHRRIIVSRSLGNAIRMGDPEWINERHKTKRSD